MASNSDNLNNYKSDDEFVVLNCIEPNDAEPEDDHGDGVSISTAEIDQWDFASILYHRVVKIKANRNRLLEYSSYFRGLLSGSFSESSCGTILIHWNAESFLSVLRFIFGCTVEILPDNFVTLYEAALFFGVEMLLSKCQIWLTEATLFTEVLLPQLRLDNLIHIWKYGVERDGGGICCSHEKDLCDAILVWLAANSEPTLPVGSNEDASTSILKQVHTSILPLWFAAGKRRCCFFSEYAQKSTCSILGMARQLSVKSLDILGDGDFSHHKIRLTVYTKKVDLAGCPQMTPELLLLSVLPSSILEPVLWKGIMQSFVNLDHHTGSNSRIARELLGKTLTFEALQEVDISNCPMLHLEVAVEYFRKSFPSLRVLRAAFLLNFRTSKLHLLVEKCPLLNDIDLTVDISPVMPTQVSILSSYQASSSESLTVTSSAPYPHWAASSANFSNPFLSNISKLSLEGRTDISDIDLHKISEICPSLSYLNIKGCISITDAGLSFVLVKCMKLHSLFACQTNFGQMSVRALCSAPVLACDSGRNFSSLASRLQSLHISGCKGVDEASLCQLISQTEKLKSLCLRETQLVDSALYGFPGSSLEIFDVSETKVSAPALAHIVCRNPGLRSLKARGCKHFSQEESETGRRELATSISGYKELYSELGKSCILEELELGWGFSFFSLEALRPALRTLKSLVVGLGGSLGQDGLELIPIICPMLEKLVLYFQVISDYLIRSVVGTLTQLRTLALCYCFGEISSLSLLFRMPNLRILKLERVAAWMTNDDLVILTQKCANLIELSLLGCRLLNTEAQDIISSGWPGLVSIHLEDCGQVTDNGVSSLFDCIALEDLLLRHNGPGIPQNLIKHAASKLPMLRKISLDTCDAKDGDFDIPDFADRYFLSNVKISRCKLQRCTLDVHNLEARKTPVHKETLVLAWDSKRLTRIVVKERL